MTDSRGPLFRDGTAADADALTELERSASLQALGHIFPQQYPYPTADVRDRWRGLLRDPRVRVGIADDDTGLLAFVALDGDVLRHLAVRPDRWGTGLGENAVNWAMAHSTIRRLWCLEQNGRALGFYRRMGWRPTGRRRAAEFPPYPAEVELAVARS